MNFLHDMHTVRHENKNLTAEEACLMVFDATRSAHPFSTCIYPSKKDFLSTLEIALLKVNNLNKDTHGTLEALKTLVNLLPDD